MNKIFYTIMEKDKFLNNSLLRDMNDNINEAIRFSTLEGAKSYFEDLRKDRGFRIVKATCELENVE